MTDVSDDRPVSQDVQQPSSGATTANDGIEEIEIGEAGRVVSARGTEDGLILRIDGGAPWETILGDLEAFLGGRRRFFEGGEVSIEWLERLPDREHCSDLEGLLKNQYGLTVVTRKRRPPKMKPLPTRSVREENPDRDAIPLFDSRDDAAVQEEMSLVEKIEQIAAGRDEEPYPEQELSGSDSGRRRLNHLRRTLGDDLFYEDDANAKVVFGTLRSGQRVETPFSLVVIGDVNPGADLVAGGDIIVVGSLRGTAHASAYDDDAFDSVIIALHMQPMQLRIGSIISRGSDEVVHGVEIARIENRRIVVEAFNPRSSLQRKSLY